MPGGRLTNVDRQRLAVGLAEGLGFAEIARQLGRPTSTVSREVARNGGVDGYRAEQANQATAMRARRQRGTSKHETPRTDAFAERFAGLMAQTGLPKMAARVLAMLITTESGQLTAAELVEQLRVSPASVSKAIGYLEALDLVRREQGRRQRYVIDDDVWLRTWVTSARSHANWADAAREGAELYGPQTRVGVRLAHMGQFFAGLSEDMVNGPADEQAQDTVDLLIALLRSLTPESTAALAGQLGWSQRRVDDALADLGRRVNPSTA